MQNNLLNKKFDNICRICLKECGIMLPIFKENGVKLEEYLSLADKISSIAEVQINEGDGLPQLICHPCNLRIEKFYEFRAQVEISDRTLRTALSTEKIDFKDENNEYYKNFISNNLSDAHLNLGEVSTIMVPDDDDMEVVWKICNANKEKYNMGYDESILNDFQAYNNESEQEFDEILMSPEKYSSGIIERKTKVQRLNNCAQCNKCFNDSQELTLHLADHVTNNEENNLNDETKCELCFEQFSSLENLKIHIQEHFCDTRVANSENNSIKSEKNINYQSNEEYHCSQCKKEFLTADECSEHIKQHKVQKLFMCGICNKVFTRNSSRKRHELNHVEKNFKCRQCGKTFLKKTELRYHVSCHVVTPPTCDICRKTFQNRQSLKLHMKRHTGESTYSCKTCGKNYFSNSELNRHVQIHLGKRDFPCSLCEQSFFSKPELTRHSKYHRGDKKFKCQICSKSYFESGHLKVHLRIHTGEKPFICEICAKAFISKSKLVRHQKIHLKENSKKSDKTNVFKTQI